MKKRFLWFIECYFSYLSGKFKITSWHGENKKLSRETRAQVAILREQGIKFSSIAARFNVSHSCIVKTLQRIKKTGEFKSEALSGRPRELIYRKKITEKNQKNYRINFVRFMTYVSLYRQVCIMYFVVLFRS